MVLGLDVGTQLFGYTILDNDGKLLISDVLDLRKKTFSSPLIKSYQVKLLLLDIKRKYTIQNVYIEQSLNAFRPGLSSANVILTIGKFNGITSWLCYETFGFEPEYIGASTARKALGIKVERGQNAKEVVLEHILRVESDFKVEYTVHGNPVAGSYDRADSLVIARAGFISCQTQKK
jgi:hypothetical protein